MGHDRTPRIRNFSRRHEERRKRADLTGNGEHGRRPGGGQASGRRKTMTKAWWLGTALEDQRQPAVRFNRGAGRLWPTPRAFGEKGSYLGIASAYGGAGVAGVPDTGVSQQGLSEKGFMATYYKRASLSPGGVWGHKE